MYNHSRFTVIKNLIVVVGMVFLFVSCGTIMLPPMEVADCKVGKATIVVEFTLPPDLASLENGLSVTEDGSKIEGKITISGKKAEFTPLYGIKDNYDYVIRIEAGTEDVNGHSLMDTFVYEYSTRNDKSPFFVDFLVEEKLNQESFSEKSLDTAEAENPVGGEIQVLQEISTLQLGFSQSVDKKSLEEGLSITPAFDYFLEYDNNDCLVTLIPQKELEINQRYVISLAASVMDIQRNSLKEEVSWSFFYKKDVHAPEISFQHTDKVENLLFTEENPPSVIEGDNLELGLDDWIILEFSEKLDLDKAASCIFLESVNTVAIAPTLEIRKDYKNGNRLALRPDWTGNSGNMWGSSWRLVVKAGIEDYSGNKTQGEKALFLSYTLEAQRPPVFLGALLVDYEKQSQLKAYFSPENPFLSLELDPQFYPNRAEELPSKVELHLFFALSGQTSSLNRISLMEHISLSASNDCCQLTLKKLLDESADEACKNQFEEFCSELEKVAENPVPEIDQSHSLVMVRFQVELLNRNSKGLISLKLGENVADSLGNTLGRAVICQVNKI